MREFLFVFGVTVVFLIAQAVVIATAVSSFNWLLPLFFGPIAVGLFAKLVCDYRASA